MAYHPVVLCGSALGRRTAPAKKYPPSFAHQTRKKRLRQVWSSHKTAIRAYLQLEHFSRQARYDGWIPTDQDLKDAKNYLKQVKTDIV